MEGEHKRMPLAQQAQIGSNFAEWCGRPIRMLASKDMGIRAAEDPAGTIGSFLIMGAFALFGQSQLMVYAILAAAFAQAVHRTRARFLKGVSSWYMGTSWLGPNGHVGAGAAALLAGIPLCQIDKAFGVWLMLAGAGCIITVQMIKARTKAIDMDMEDAAIESFARQQRMQHFYNQMEDE